MEDVVGDAGRAAQVNARAVQAALGIDDIAQGAEEHLTGTGDHFAIDKCIGGGVEQFKAHTAVLLVDPHLEILVGLKDGLGVIDVGAGVKDGQYALAEKRVAGA